MSKIHEKSLVPHMVYGFAMYRDLQDVDYPEPIVPNADADGTLVESNPNQSLFDLIFSVDPLTGLPQGDVAQYLSDEVHPDVKRFIELQLHSPSPMTADAAGELSGLSDDDIAKFTRNADESVYQYRDRLFESLLSEQYKEKRSMVKPKDGGAE